MKSKKENRNNIVKWIVYKEVSYEQEVSGIYT
mgnify:FL=1